MEAVLVLAAATILMMVLAFLSLTREDRELARENLMPADDAQSPI